MSKEAFYFPHDYEAIGDPKLQALVGEFGAVGYGVFWRIIEMLHSDQEHKLPLKQYIYIAIAKQMLTSAEQIEAIVKQNINVYELFDSDGQFFWSDRVNRNFEMRAQLSEKRSVAGKLGAIAKQNLAKLSKGKEKKEKEIKNNNIEFSQFWNTYHSITVLPKTDFQATQKYWNKLSETEQQKAIDNIKLYYDSLNDKKYCKKARTYLADKNFNDEFKQQKKVMIPAGLDPKRDLIPIPDWKEPQRTRNADR
jgi:plasmid maintenance system killer protein